MSFLRKKRIKFSVEIVVDRLSDVSLVNATLFAKCRLVECGSFEACTDSHEVRAHVCVLHPIELSSTSTKSEELPSSSSIRTSGEAQKTKQPFRFQCRIPYDQQTGELDRCPFKISIRRIERAGRPSTKLGYVIVNLSEFAATGSLACERSYLLDGYSGNQRQDNSRVHITVRMLYKNTDPLFKSPNNSSQLSFIKNKFANLTPGDRKNPTLQIDDELRRRLDFDDKTQIQTSLGPGISMNEMGMSQSSSTYSMFPSSPGINPEFPRSDTKLTAGSKFNLLSQTGSTQGTSQSGSNITSSFFMPSSSSSTFATPTRHFPGITSQFDRQSWHDSGIGLSCQDRALLIAQTNRSMSKRRLSEDRILGYATIPKLPEHVQQTRRDPDAVIEEVLAAAAEWEQQQLEERKKEQKPDTDNVEQPRSSSIDDDCAEFTCGEEWTPLSSEKIV